MILEIPDTPKNRIIFVCVGFALVALIVGIFLFSYDTQIKGEKSSKALPSLNRYIPVYVPHDAKSLPFINAQYQYRLTLDPSFKLPKPRDIDGLVCIGYAKPPAKLRVEAHIDDKLYFPKPHHELFDRWAIQPSNKEVVHPGHYRLKNNFVKVTMEIKKRPLPVKLTARNVFWNSYEKIPCYVATMNVKKVRVVEEAPNKRFRTWGKS